MERQDLFANLLILANSDGKFTQEEIDFLAIRAERWGLEPGEVAAMLDAAKSADLDLLFPRDPDESREVLREMIQLMAIDGHLADIEKQICALAAAEMDISVAEFNQIVNRLLNEHS